MDVGTNPVILALGAGLATWGLTALGSGVVFISREPFSQRTMDAMLGSAAGVMLAAAFWSLLLPALEGSAHLGRLAFVPVALGFLVGAGCLRLIDMVTPHLHPRVNMTDGPSSTLSRTSLLVIALTLHNIPEGLAVGVSMGSVDMASGTTFTGAVTLALAIGLQNIPEGMAVAIPLLREGHSRGKAFFIGQLSGFVEPLAAILGALAVGITATLLPFALAFAAGAMIFVVVEEVIPESHASGHGDAATMGVVFGFVLMMCLDVVLAGS